MLQRANHIAGLGKMHAYISARWLQHRCSPSENTSPNLVTIEHVTTSTCKDEPTGCDVRMRTAHVEQRMNECARSCAIMSKKAAVMDLML